MIKEGYPDRPPDKKWESICYFLLIHHFNIHFGGSEELSH